MPGVHSGARLSKLVIKHGDHNDLEGHIEALLEETKAESRLLRGADQQDHWCVISPRSIHLAHRQQRRGKDKSEKGCRRRRDRSI